MQITNTPNHRWGVTFSWRKTLPPKAATANLNAEDGKTKLTLASDSIASSAKNATAINVIPVHIAGTVIARPVTRAIDDGRKSVTSPIVFMARETKSSPPVPTKTITI